MKSFLAITLLTALSVLSYGQANTGTLKVFSETTGITVFVDEVQQANYQNITGLPVGTHYVRIINSSGLKIYGQVVTITKDEVTTILIEGSKEASSVESVPVPVVQKPAETQQNKTTGGTGTINVFSELAGITVYLNEAKQGEDIKTINAVPAGDHYLKVMKDGVSIFGEIISVAPGQVSSVLIKNSGQVEEKIMESKIAEREQYNAEKIDVIYSSNSISQTKGASTLFPGYFGYYGYSNSVTSTTQISDFKIIQGGLKEISERQLANLSNNQRIIDQAAANDAKSYKLGSTGAIFALVAIATTIPILIDWASEPKNNPGTYLHKNNPVHPDWEVYVFMGGVVSGLAGYGILNASEKVHPPHYYSVDEAAKDALKHNKKLKEKLGLPEGYDIK